MDDWGHTTDLVQWIETFIDSDTHDTEPYSAIPPSLRLRYVLHIFQWLDQLEDCSTQHNPICLLPIQFLRYRF